MYMIMMVRMRMGMRRCCKLLWSSAVRCNLIYWVYRAKTLKSLLFELLGLILGHYRLFEVKFLLGLLSEFVVSWLHLSAIL